MTNRRDAYPPAARIRFPPNSIHGDVMPHAVPRLGAPFQLVDPPLAVAACWVPVWRLVSGSLRR